MMRKTLLVLLASVLLWPASAQENHNFEVSKHLDIFNSLYRELDLYYVDTLEAKKAVGNAILYMLDRLDPYTQYYPEEETRDLKEMTTGKYAGIGSPILYRKDLDRCVFSSPYEGMPAAKAGVRTGDVIMSIDGRDVGGRGASSVADYTSSVSASLRGESGTTLLLKVKRAGTGKMQTFKIVRQTIERPSVPYYGLLRDTIGYVLLTSYTDNTARDLRLAVVNLKQRGARRLVLDLRGNPGGLMREAISVVGSFVPRGTMVLRTQGKVEELNKTFKTTVEPLDLEIPMAVLVNYGTASAAEITSGALQDYDRAIVVGQRTYGKGLVQEPRELPYGAILKLTTSKYFIPSGRCVQAYDFKNRNADGMPRHLPDSLSKEFFTAAGRLVRDGGGITPDVVVAPDSLPYFVSYLEASDVFFDFCATYRNEHESIAPASEFVLSDADYEAFIEFVKKSNFSYESRSLQMLSLLRRMAQAEGCEAGAAVVFDSLENCLRRDVEAELRFHKADIVAQLEMTIVENYYYERGVAEYLLRDDKELGEALRVLCDEAAYRRLLSGVPEP